MAAGCFYPGLQPAGDFFSLMVKDQGVGMDRDTLENVFIPFFSKKAQGTGLGMAIAKKVVEAHGGQIFIRSQPERGTEVRIEFPR
jgi:signal transduction histidine kinase